MAEGGVTSEGRSWCNPRTWFSKPKAISPESVSPLSTEEVVPVIAPQEYLQVLNRDMITISEEQKKYFPDMAERVYVPLIAEIDTLPDKETKQALIEAVNRGDKDVIAVLSFRIWNKADPHRRGVINSKVPYISTFAGIMQREVVAEVAAQDDTDRIDTAKRSWAEGAFFKAVESPNWKGGIQAGDLPGSAFTRNEGASIAEAIDKGMRNPGNT